MGIDTNHNELGSTLEITTSDTNPTSTTDKTNLSTTDETH